ncbi:MAG TPA: DUF2254 domain-containing protein [Longimicrobium sp.]|jgi:uncharacterized membrane protein
MLARLQSRWVQVRDSLWFIPTVLTLVSAALAAAVTTAERRGLLVANPESAWAFSGGAEGARGVLNAIAGSLITVTGVVFSVTIVALQLASVQFTPRVLRNFTADRANQVVLGVFIGTFTYTLLVLRTVHSGDNPGEIFVPQIAVTISVILVLASIGCLIFFINHAARSIQVATILARVSRETICHVHKLFPEVLRDGDPAPRFVRAPDGEEPGRVAAARSGYLQAVDMRGLSRLATARGVVVKMELQVGDFVLPGQPLASVWPAGAADDAVCGTVRGAFILGSERTPEQDVEFGIIEIADIAVKALSPAINDPTTALRCIDRLSEILLEIARRAPARDACPGVILRHTTFERAVSLSFDQIRHNGAENPAITKKLLSTLLNLLELVPAAHQAPLLVHKDALLSAADSDIDNPVDRAAVVDAVERLHA